MKIVFRPENFERAYSAIETQISLLNLWIDCNLALDDGHDIIHDTLTCIHEQLKEMARATEETESSSKTLHFLQAKTLEIRNELQNKKSENECLFQHLESAIKNLGDAANAVKKINAEEVQF